MVEVNVSRGGKILLVVLALVAVAFVVLLFVSEDGDGTPRFPEPDGAPGWIRGLDERLVPRRALRYDETRGPCKTEEGYRLESGERCDIRIAASDAPARELVLELVEGPSVRVELIQPGTVPARVTLRARDTLRVYDDPADLRLACEGIGGETCGLRLR